MNKETLKFAFLNGVIGGILNVVLVGTLVLGALRLNIGIEPEIILMASGFVGIIIFIILLHIFTSILAKRIKENHKSIVGISTLIFAIYYIFSFLVTGLGDLLGVGIYLALFYWISNSNIKEKTKNNIQQEKITL